MTKNNKTHKITEITKKQKDTQNKGIGTDRTTGHTEMTKNNRPRTITERTEK